ncbi:unnamed protein product [[Candida] boidinii]|nr:unnamed protein product [[Candida] boidinii]
MTSHQKIQLIPLFMVNGQFSIFSKSFEIGLGFVFEESDTVIDVAFDVAVVIVVEFVWFVISVAGWSSIFGVFKLTFSMNLPQ